LPPIPVIGDQDLARSEPRKVLGEGFGIAASQAFEGAGTDLDPSQGGGFLVAAEGGQIAVLGALEEFGRGYGPRRWGCE